MAMTVKSKEELPEPKKVKTDHNNINLSRDQFIEKRRKEKELNARLAVEQARIEKEIDAEGDVKEEVQTGDETQTVATVKKTRAKKAKEVKA